MVLWSVEFLFHLKMIEMKKRKSIERAFVFGRVLSFGSFGEFPFFGERLKGDRCTTSGLYLILEFGSLLF